jgi:hypothetical protein
MAGTKCCAVLLFVLFAVPARAQTPHRLVVDPSLMVESRPLNPIKPTSDPPTTTFDIRPFIESVTGALSATSHLRAADAAVGTVLIAFGTRRHHPMSSAVFVGVHAVDLAVGKKVPTAWRGFDIEPDVGKGRIAITVQRTLGPR